MSIAEISTTRRPSTHRPSSSEGQPSREAPVSASQPARRQLIERLGERLACACGGTFRDTTHGDETSYLCADCGKQGQRRNEQFVFGGFTSTQLKEDWLNRVKEGAKRRLGRFYRTAIQLISPVYTPPHIPRFLKTFDLGTDLVADLGSGPLVYDERVVCVDGANYPNVHLVADLERLPLEDNTFDGLVSCAVLEHVPDPEAHVAEMQRVLKPGGRVLCFIPFMQGFHASPYDYQRYTHRGMAELFKNFEVIDVKVGAGPTCGMLWVLQEWLALVLSFGSMRLYKLLAPLMWILSPLKFLDLLLNRHPAANVIASGFTIVARKRG